MKNPNIEEEAKQALLAVINAPQKDRQSLEAAIRRGSALIEHCSLKDRPGFLEIQFQAEQIYQDLYVPKELRVNYLKKDET